MYIGIAGNIGSGKSAMAKLLTEEFDCVVSDERSKSNPYLANFYSDMSRWALNLQVYFLTQRFKDVQRAMWSEKVVIQDRTIYEDAYIFVENLRRMGHFSYDDYTTYRELFDVMSAFITPPDLLIYLKASVKTLVHHIRMRGIEHEKAIGEEYLTLLNMRYNEWIESYKHNTFVIDIDNTDFINNESDRTKIIDAIKRELPILKRLRNH